MGGYFLPFLVKVKMVYVKGKIGTPDNGLCRWKPLTFIHNMDYDYDYWSLVLSLVNMDLRKEVVDNAIMYSVYDSGQWLAYRFDSNPNIGWISGGNELFELMVSLSHCLLLKFL